MRNALITICLFFGLACKTTTMCDIKAYAPPIKQIIFNQEFNYEVSVYEEWRTFKITAYCPCDKCCGKSDGITASGTIAQQGRTVGVDTSIFEYGAAVEIAGLGTFIAEDTGGAVDGYVIDVFFNTHEQAIAFGCQERMVCINREVKIQKTNNATKLSRRQKSIVHKNNLNPQEWILENETDLSLKIINKENGGKITILKL